MHIFQQVLSCSGTFNGSLAGDYLFILNLFLFMCLNVFFVQKDQQQSITMNGNFDVKRQANGHH